MVVAAALLLVGCDRAESGKIELTMGWDAGLVRRDDELFGFLPYPCSDDLIASMELEVGPIAVPTPENTRRVLRVEFDPPRPARDVMVSVGC